MNKKSRIKTTLDSLFTGGKLPAEEKTPAPVTKPSVDKKSAAPRKKEPVAKPAAKIPQAIIEPAKVEEPQKVLEPVKPVKPVPVKPVEPIAIPAPMETTVKDDQPALKSVEVPVAATIPQPVLTAKPIQSPVQEKKTMDEEKVLDIARTIDQAADSLSQDEEHLVIFSLGRELYGVTIHAVESIIKLQAITQVPRTAGFILGVTNLRGTVVPVLDLRIRFNLPLNENTANTRIVIVNSEGSKVGIVVDEVTEVLKVSRTTIQPPPPLSTTIESSFINGIASIDNRLVILLDLEKVLASSSRQHNR
jgi:purine-binding chemotaxis protein CheW